VGVYVDEEYQAFRASHGQQLYDLQQVEVVRGPQGTLYGRNTTGGAINFITVQPNLQDTRGYATVGYGNYDRKDFEGAVEFTPISGVLGVRLAGTFVDTDPYYRNVLPAGLNASAAGGASGLNIDSGISPGGFKNYALRGIVRFDPTDAIDLSLKGEGSYLITDTLKATLGLRYTKDTDVYKDGLATYYDDAGAARLITVSNFAGPYFIQPLDFSLAGCRNPLAPDEEPIGMGQWHLV
jgi:iron complex outermembrane receptor protein